MFRFSIHFKFIFYMAQSKYWPILSYFSFYCGVVNPLTFMYLYMLVFSFSLWFPWGRDGVPDFGIIRAQLAIGHKIDAEKLLIELSLHNISEENYSRCRKVYGIFHIPISIQGLK